MHLRLTLTCIGELTFYSIHGFYSILREIRCLPALDKTQLLANKQFINFVGARSISLNNPLCASSYALFTGTTIWFSPGLEET